MIKKISIIIPVYNGQQYIERCVNSILNQKGFPANDLEILLINDGSKDSSIDILHMYETKYEHVVKVISHDNMGVAKTRNKGIKIASGKYIMFIDQDDWVDDDYCSRFYSAIEESGADVVAGGYRRPDKNGNICQITKPRNTEYQKYIIMAAWAKIHRASFLKSTGIEFFPNKFGEDSVFTIREIACAKKWQQLDYVGYNWFFNEVSVSNTAQKRLGKEEVKSLLALLEELSVSPEEQKQKMFQYYMLRTCIYYLLFSGRKATPKDYMFAYQKMKIFINNNTNPAYLIRFNPHGERLFAKMIIFIFILLHKIGLMDVFAKLYCKG